MNHLFGLQLQGVLGNWHKYNKLSNYLIHIWLLRSGSLSNKCAKLQTVAASNNREHMSWSHFAYASHYIQSFTCSYHQRLHASVTLLLLVRATYIHKRNFVVKCEGNSLVWNQYITEPKEKNVGGHGILYPHCLKKWEGRVPNVPQVIPHMHIYGCYSSPTSRS